MKLQIEAMFCPTGFQYRSDSTQGLQTMCGAKYSSFYPSFPLNMFGESIAQHHLHFFVAFLKQCTIYVAELIGIINRRPHTIFTTETPIKINYSTK